MVTLNLGAFTPKFSLQFHHLSDNAIAHILAGGLFVTSQAQKLVHEEVNVHRQPTAVLIIRNIEQLLEKLRVKYGHQEVE